MVFCYANYLRCLIMVLDNAGMNNECILSCILSDKPFPRGQAMRCRGKAPESVMAASRHVRMKLMTTQNVEPVCNRCLNGVTLQQLNSL